MEAEIRLNRVEVKAHIGVTENERAETQNLEIEAILKTNIRNAVIYDDLEEAVDYVEAVARIEAAAAAREYHLVETLSYEICRELLGLSEVFSVRVKVTKRPEVLEGRAESITLAMELTDCEEL